MQVQFSGLKLENHFGVTSEEFNLSAKNKQAGISFKTLWHMDLAQNQVPFLPECSLPLCKMVQNLLKLQQIGVLMYCRLLPCGTSPIGCVLFEIKASKEDINSR